MARTALSVTEIDRTGTDIATLSAANVDGHSVANAGEVFLIVKNADASGKTITVQTPQTVQGLAVAEYTITVAASEHQIFGPFPVRTFNQATGVINVDFSDVTSVTVGAFKVGS